MEGKKEQRIRNEEKFEGEGQIRTNAGSGKYRTFQGKSRERIKLKGLKQNVLKGWMAQKRQNLKKT